MIAGVASFYMPSAFVAVAGLVTAVVFALWIGAASLLMVYRPEADRAPAAGTAFAH